MQNTPSERSATRFDSQAGDPEGAPEAQISFGDSPNCGNLILNSSESQYLSGTHWVAILNSIADLKKHVRRQEDNYVNTPRMPHVLLLYGCKQVSKEEILEALPTRAIVDRFVSQYFNRLDLAPSKLHHY
jgi:hypothetical protein